MALHSLSPCRQVHAVAFNMLIEMVQGGVTLHSRGAVEVVRRGEVVGVQPLGTKMEQRILEPFLFQPIKRGALEKPVLIVTITGAPPPSFAQRSARHKPPSHSMCTSIFVDRKRASCW